MSDELSIGQGEELSLDDTWCPEQEAEALHHLEVPDNALGADELEPCSTPERVRQLDLDARIVEALRKHDFAGPLYDCLAKQLMAYSLPTLLKMMNNGSVFRRAGELGRPVPTHMITGNWTAEEREEIALDSTIDGLNLFREYGLVKGNWRPEGGATLATYCVGAALLRFPRRYIGWFRDQQRNHAELGLAGPDELDTYLTDIPDQRAVDPAASAAVRDEVERIWVLLPDLVRRGLVLRSVGYTQAQAADRLDLTPKALESRIGRARAQIRAKGFDESDQRGRDAR